MSISILDLTLLFLAIPMSLTAGVMVWMVVCLDFSRINPKLHCNPDSWMSETVRVSAGNLVSLPMMGGLIALVIQRMSSLLSLMAGRPFWKSCTRIRHHRTSSSISRCMACISHITVSDSQIVNQPLQRSGKQCSNLGGMLCHQGVSHTSISCVRRNIVMLEQLFCRWSLKSSLLELTFLQMMCLFCAASDGIVTTQWLWKQRTCVIIRLAMNYCLMRTLMNGATLDMEFNATCTLNHVSHWWPNAITWFLVLCSRSSYMMTTDQDFQALLRVHHSILIFNLDSNNQKPEVLRFYKSGLLTGPHHMFQLWCMASLVPVWEPAMQLHKRIISQYVLRFFMLGKTLSNRKQ